MSWLESLYPYLAALLPTVGVAFLFYFVIKHIIEADRSERKALAEWKKEHEVVVRDAPGNAPDGPAQD